MLVVTDHFYENSVSSDRRKFARDYNLNSILTSVPPLLKYDFKFRCQALRNRENLKFLYPEIVKDDLKRYEKISNDNRYLLKILKNKTISNSSGYNCLINYRDINLQKYHYKFISKILDLARKKSCKNRAIYRTDKAVKGHENTTREFNS